MMNIFRCSGLTSTNLNLSFLNLWWEKREGSKEPILHRTANDARMRIHTYTHTHTVGHLSLRK